MGKGQAPTYFAARLTAVNSCLAYNFDRWPGSAYVPPNNFHFFPTPSPPSIGGLTQSGLPNLEAPGLSGFALLSSARAGVIRARNARAIERPHAALSSRNRDVLVAGT